MTCDSDIGPDVGCFVNTSAVLTGFSCFELYGTGQAGAYYRLVNQKVPSELGQILTALADLPQEPNARDQAVRARVLSNPSLGPVARNIIKLWYLGQWDDLTDATKTEIPSPAAYTAGLVWTAIGAHPQGAKQQGFGAWALPPDSDLAPE